MSLVAAACQTRLLVAEINSNATTVDQLNCKISKSGMCATLVMHTRAKAVDIENQPVHVRRCAACKAYIGGSRKPSTRYTVAHGMGSRYCISYILVNSHLQVPALPAPAAYAAAFYGYSMVEVERATFYVITQFVHDNCDNPCLCIHIMYYAVAALPSSESVDDAFSSTHRLWYLDTFRTIYPPAVHTRTHLIGSVAIKLVVPGAERVCFLPYDTHDITPSGANFEADFLDNGESANAEPCVYGKATLFVVCALPVFEKLGSEIHLMMCVILSVP